MLEYLKDSSFSKLVVPPEDRNYQALAINIDEGIYLYRDAGSNYHMAEVQSEESYKDPN